MLFAFFSVFAASVAALYWLVFHISPATASPIQIGAVYASLFGIVWSLAALLSRGFGAEFPMRQGMIFGLLACLTLWLLASSLFSLVTTALLLGVFVLLELYALSH